MRCYSIFFLLIVGGSVMVGQNNTVLPDIDPQAITIVRDQWGVPHIYAKTDPEVAYGLAWAQCEDNFEVIQQTYLFTKGHLGRVYGKGGAPGDFFSKMLMLYERIDSLMEKDVSPEFMKYLEGYCQGINAYAEAHPKELLYKKLFPAEPKDVLVSYSAKIAEWLGMGRIAGGVVSGNTYDEAANNISFAQKGSNAFAFSRKITTDQRTYLIGNPHVKISGPEAFYEVHVVSEEGLNFHGAMFPGSVSPQIGTNQHLGWSHTNNYYDHTDIFLLNMHPTEENMYEFDGEWIPLKEKKIKLAVNLKGLPLTIKVKRMAYWSKYGPTLKSEEGNYFAIRSAPIFNIKAPEQWYKMNKAQNLNEFKQALEWDGLTYFNITYADKDDNVLYLCNGQFPKRQAGYDWEEVVPGNTSQTLWTSYLPLDERPQILNPDCGYVYNVNHSPYKCSCKDSWLDGNRYDPLVNFDGIIDDLPRSIRFRELYEDGDTISMSRLKQIKYDVTFPKDHFVTDILDQLVKHKNETYSELIEEMKDWDRAATLDQVAPTLVYLFFEGLDMSRRELEKQAGKMSDKQLNEALAFTRNHLMTHFGRLDVAFKDFSKLKRGDKEVPVYGYWNKLGNRWGNIDKDNGKFYAGGGDNFMMFVQYDHSGVVAFETIVPYGNSSRPGSPHYTDQMELYASKGAKKMTLDKEKIMENAEKVYHPE